MSDYGEFLKKLNPNKKLFVIINYLVEVVCHVSPLMRLRDSYARFTDARQSTNKQFLPNRNRLYNKRGKQYKRRYALFPFISEFCNKTANTLRYWKTPLLLNL